MFDAGTIGWALGLANVEGSIPENDVIKTVTGNLLNQFLAGQTPTVPVNQFAGATVVARSWYETTFWAPEGWLRVNALDGRRNSAFGASMGYTSGGSASQTQEEWIYLQASSVRTFSKVVLYPRNDPGAVGVGFPVDFKIQVWDGANWITRVAEYNYPLPSTGQKLHVRPRRYGSHPDPGHEAACCGRHLLPAAGRNRSVLAPGGTAQRRTARGYLQSRPLQRAGNRPMLAQHPNPVSTRSAQVFKARREWPAVTLSSR